MPDANRSLPRPKNGPFSGAPRGLILLALLPLLALLLATPAIADPPPPDLEVAALGHDLEVRVVRDTELPLPTSATLTLATTDGRLLVEQSFTPVAGGKVLLLPGALADYLSDGWFYRVTLVDTAPDASNTLPFEVTLDCLPGEPCKLLTHPGIAAAASTLVVSELMYHALDPALGLGQGGDLLDEIRDLDPALLGQVNTFAHRLAALLEPLPDPPEPDSEIDCLCFWTTARLLRPAIRETSNRVSDPVRDRRLRGPGAARWLRSWYDGDILNSTHSTEWLGEGESELRMALRCNEILEWEWKLIDGQPVHVPKLGGPCEAGCEGNVTAYGEYHARAHASVDAGWFSSAEGAAQEQGLFTLNGRPVFNRIARVGKEVRREWGFNLGIPGLGSIEIDNGNISIEGSPSEAFMAEISYSVNGNDGSVTQEIVVGERDTVVEPASARLQTQANTFARGNSDADSQGRTENCYLIAAYGDAACALPREAAVWVYDRALYCNADGLRLNTRNFFAGFGMEVEP
ncbi:MAG: hypothetical protein AAF560_13045 [Acidobacteriota bacterium]